MKQIQVDIALNVWISFIIFSFGGLLKKPKPSIYLEPGPGHYDIPGTIGYIPKYLAARQSKSQGQIPNYFDLKTFWIILTIQTKLKLWILISDQLVQFYVIY